MSDALDRAARKDHDRYRREYQGPEWDDAPEVERVISRDHASDNIRAFLDFSGSEFMALAQAIANERTSHMKLGSAPKPNDTDCNLARAILSHLRALATPETGEIHGS